MNSSVIKKENHEYSKDKTTLYKVINGLISPKSEKVKENNLEKEFKELIAIEMTQLTTSFMYLMSLKNG